MAYRLWAGFAPKLWLNKRSHRLTFHFPVSGFVGLWLWNYAGISIMLTLYDRQHLISIARLFLSIIFGLICLFSLFTFTSRIDWLNNNPDNLGLIIDFILASQTKFFIDLSFAVFLLAATIHCLRSLRDNEMTVFAVSGVSFSRLLRPISLMAAALMCFNFFLAHYSLPGSLARSRIIMSQIQLDALEGAIQPLVFQQLNDDLTVYVEKRVSSGNFSGIALLDKQDNNLTRLVLAEKAFITVTDERPHLIFQNGRITTYSPSVTDPKANEISFRQYKQDLSFIQNADTEVDTQIRSAELTLTPLLSRLATIDFSTQATPPEELVIFINRLIISFSPVVILFILLFLIEELMIARRSLFIPLLIEFILALSFIALQSMLITWSRKSFISLALLFMQPFIFIYLSSLQRLFADLLRKIITWLSAHRLRPISQK